MEIIIKGDPKEIADLVRDIQDRPAEKLLVDLRPPMDVFKGDYSFGAYGGAGNSGGYGGNGVNYDRISAEALSNIDRTLRTLCSFVKDFGVFFGIKSEGSGMFGNSAVVNGTGAETPVETMD